MDSIRLKDLSIGYQTGKDQKVIASNLNVKVDKGTLVCLLGPNGGGKSTMLKTLGGFLDSLYGEVLFGDKDIKKMSASEKSKTISVVLTQRPQFNALTAFELVAMGRAPYTGFFGKLTEHDKEIINTAMKAVGIEELAERKVTSLSDGEKQKLMIAKSVAQDTEVIILDEPTAFLDYPSKVETMRLLNKLCHQNKKIVFVSTHDLDIVMSTTDHIWLIDKEKGFETGSIGKLCSNGGISRYFNSKGLRFDPDTRHFIINKSEIN